MISAADEIVRGVDKMSGDGEKMLGDGEKMNLSAGQNRRRLQAPDFHRENGLRKPASPTNYSASPGNSPAPQRNSPAAEIILSASPMNLSATHQARCAAKCCRAAS